MNAPTYDPTNGQDRAWLAEQVDAARRVAACPGFVINRDIASALVAVADYPVQARTETVYLVLITEGATVEIDSARWRIEEAEAERDAMELKFPRYGWHIQAVTVQGAR